MAKKGKRGKQRAPDAGSKAGPGEHAPVPSSADDASASTGAEPQAGARETSTASTASTVVASAGASSALQPTGSGRLLANAFIVLFLAYQVAMPLRYYLGGRGYDERFSWRMFSTLRMQTCKVEVTEQLDGQSQRVDLRKDLQVAWLGMLERYRRPVVDKLLARRCERGKAPAPSEVRFVRNCTDTDGSVLPETVVTRDCARRVVRELSAGGAQ